MLQAHTQLAFKPSRQREAAEGRERGVQEPQGHDAENPRLRRIHRGFLAWPGSGIDQRVVHRADTQVVLILGRGVGGG